MLYSCVVYGLNSIIYYIYYIYIYLTVIKLVVLPDVLIFSPQRSQIATFSSDLWKCSHAKLLFLFTEVDDGAEGIALGWG